MLPKFKIIIPPSNVHLCTFSLHGCVMSSDSTHVNLSLTFKMAYTNAQKKIHRKCGWFLKSTPETRRA